MAYACPVCSEPQVDAEHLANHLAFTAITGDDDHEQWLDSTVEEWDQLGQEGLAAVIVDHAEETEFPVDLDAQDGAIGGREPDEDGGHQHGHAHRQGEAGHSQDAVTRSGTRREDLDDEAKDVLAEAREITRRMQADESASKSSNAAQEPNGETGETSGQADNAGGAGDPDPSDSETQ